MAGKHHSCLGRSITKLSLALLDQILQRPIGIDVLAVANHREKHETPIGMCRRDGMRWDRTTRDYTGARWANTQRSAQARDCSETAGRLLSMQRSAIYTLFRFSLVQQASAMTPRKACATNFGTVDAIEALEVAGDVFSIRTGWIRAIQLRFGPLCRVAEVWTFLLAGIGHTNHVDRTQRLWRSHIHGGCCRGCSSLRLRNRRRNPHRAFIRASSRSAVSSLSRSRSASVVAINRLRSSERASAISARAVRDSDN